MSLQTNEQTTATTSTPSTTTPTVATTSSEPKEEDIGISLRPGGGSRKKPALSTSTSTSASESQPPTKQTSRPGWNDTKTKSKDSNTPSSNYNAPSSSPSKESVNDFPVGEPFTSETNEAKQEYDRTYISKFRTLCTDAPQELQESLVEFPELQPKVASMLNTSGQFSYGGGGNYPQRQFSGSSFQFQQGGQGFQQGQYFNQSGFPQEGSSGFPQQQRGPPSKFAKQPYPQQQRRPPGAQSGMPMTNKSTELGRRAENPWAPRPSFLKDEKDQVLRDIKGVLNKITPEKFTKLSTKIQDLFGQVTDDQIFAESISLVFAKAVSEPNFSKLYAELCVKLSDVAVKVPDGKLAFRRALLNRCQEEFERASRKVEDLPEDPEERALAKEKDRKNKLGNVKFIGELFKMTLLAERIIHGCIKILFNTIYKYKDDKETVEMNSELLCKLVATTGKRMDNPEAKSYMDTYFSHIQKLSQAPTISSRIRFMFQNLIELRENNWIPRREENAPKKISEVHADALQKAYEEEYNLNQPAPEIKATTTKAPAEVAKPAVDAKKKNKKKKKKATEIKAGGSFGDDGLEDQISSILRDYLTSNDYKETEAAVKELKAPNALSKLVEIGVTFSLERSEKDRDMTSKLFSGLFASGILTQDHFVRGFRSVLENLGDLEVDIPFAPKLIGKIIGQAVVDKCIAITWLDGIDDKVKVPMMETINRK